MSGHRPEEATQMKRKRQDEQDLTPVTEDRGIFKGSIVTVRLELTPLRRTSKRGDLVCVGYFTEKRVEVIFPGRRRNEARELEMALDEFTREKARQASSMGVPAPHASKLRFPIEIEGVWRVRLDEPEEDELERIYQFMVGRWLFTDSSGREISGGESPITRPITRMPVF